MVIRTHPVLVRAVLKKRSCLIYFQIEATRYLVENLHIIDPRRIGVWGWSYGGYTTLRILSEEKQDLFQCGIAVAPVTNWRFYGEPGFFSLLSN